MKKIGFIDYYISEWHANNYPNWIKAINEKTGEDFKVAYAWAEKDVSPLDGVSTKKWCEKYGAEKCGTIEELCEKADYILILSPSNPEKHLPYASIALRYGKPTYIDKTFAPNSAEAKEIFDIAKKHNTPFFTSSALRYADELKDMAGKGVNVSITGGGSNIEEYIIHQLEMAVKLMGVGATEVYAAKEDETVKIAVRYNDDRAVSLHYSPNYPFTAAMTDRKGKTVTLPINSDFFENLLRDILRFYNENGKVSFDTAETMEIMRLRETALSALTAPEKWIKVMR